MYLKISFLFLLFAIPLLGCGPSKSVYDGEEFVPPVYPPPPDKAKFVWERTFRSSFDVKELTAMDKLKQFATGAAGVGTGLAKPYGVAVYKGKVYITDTVARQILMLDVPGGDVKKIGTEGVGALAKPIGSSIDRRNGTLYVADNTAKRIVVFDENGEYLRAIGGNQILRRPTGVTVSADGSQVYVVDTGGIDTSAHHVYVFDSMSGDLLQKWGSRGKQEGQFNLPLQAATAPDGTIYVVDGGNFRVQAFSPDGNLIKVFGGIGNRTGQFSRPKGIAVGPAGNIYVVDTTFGNFQIFNPAGELLTYVGAKGRRGMPGEFLLPAGIAVDEDGRVYVVDQFFRKVDVFRPTSMKASEGYLSSVRKKKKG